jgi:hypothetical protein
VSSGIVVFTITTVVPRGDLNSFAHAPLPDDYARFDPYNTDVRALLLTGIAIDPAFCMPNDIQDTA